MVKLYELGGLLSVEGIGLHHRPTGFWTSGRFVYRILDWLVWLVSSHS